MAIKRDDPLAATLTRPIQAKAEMGSIVNSRINGSMRAPRQSAAQVADQARMDREMGFTPNGGAPPVSVANKILANRSDRLKKDGYDLDYAENAPALGSDYVKQQVAAYDKRNPPGPGVASGAPTNSGVAVKAVGDPAALNQAGAGPLAPTLQPTLGAKDASGTLLQNGRSTGLGATDSNGVLMQGPDVVDRAAPPGPAATSSALPSPPIGATAPGSMLNRTAPTMPTTGPTPNPAPTPSPTPTAAGRTTAAGVSNSQAAGFEQPTKANPIPTTPTSPEMDANNLDPLKKQRVAGF